MILPPSHRQRADAVLFFPPFRRLPLNAEIPFFFSSLINKRPLSPPCCFRRLYQRVMPAFALSRICSLFPFFSPCSAVGVVCRKNLSPPCGNAKNFFFLHSRQPFTWRRLKDLSFMGIILQKVCIPFPSPQKETFAFYPSSTDIVIVPPRK